MTTYYNLLFFALLLGALPAGAYRELENTVQAPKENVPYGSNKASEKINPKPAGIYMKPENTVQTPKENVPYGSNKASEKINPKPVGVYMKPENTVQTPKENVPYGSNKASEKINPEECANHLKRNSEQLEGFCPIISAGTNSQNFALEITRKGDQCEGHVKWIGMPLDTSILECLSAELQTNDSNDEFTLVFQGKEIAQESCPPIEMNIDDLEIVFSNPIAEDEDEEDDDEEEEEEEGEKEDKIPTFADCQWDILYKEKKYALKRNGDELTISELEGVNITVDNESNIDCDVSGDGYNCSHQIDDSSHTVTLTVSTGDDAKSETCKIPSLDEARKEQQSYGRFPVTPVRPPRPIRHNFGNTILSQGVF